MRHIFYEILQLASLFIMISLLLPLAAIFLSAFPTNAPPAYSCEQMQMSNFHQPVHLDRKLATGVSVTKSLGIGVGFLFGEGFIAL